MVETAPPKGSTARQTKKAPQKAAPKTSEPNQPSGTRRASTGAGKENIIHGTAKRTRTGQSDTPDTMLGSDPVQDGDAQPPKPKLTITFKRGPEFNADDYDLIIVPYDRDGIPKELMAQPPFNDERVYSEILMATSKFEAPIATLPSFKLLLLYTDRFEFPSLERSIRRNAASLEQFINISDVVRILDFVSSAAPDHDQIFLTLFGPTDALVPPKEAIEYDLRTISPPNPETLSILKGRFQKFINDLGLLEYSFIGFDHQAQAKADTRPHFLADHATDEDLLGYHPYALGIAAFVKDERTELPLTIAIDGAWGKGKSSLMKMVRNELDPKWRDGERELPHMGWWHGLWATITSPFRILWIWLLSFTAFKADIPAKHDERRFVTAFVNAWRHGKGTQLKARIVSELLQTMTARFGPDFLLRLELKRLDRVGLFTAAAKSVLTNAITLGIVSLCSAVLVGALWLGREIPLLPAGWVATLTAKKEATTLFALLGNALLFAWERRPSVKLDDYLKTPDYLKLAGDDAQIEDDFHRILAALKERDCHLALFVDDLDRCSPGECAAVVEALNTFFGGEKNECLFILGMHREMVASALEVAYEKLVVKINTAPMLAEQKPFGRRFLEKIVQFVVALPEPDEAATQKFLDALTADKKRGSLEDIKALEAAQQKEAHVAERRGFVNRSAESFLPKILKGSFIQKGMVDTTDAMLERFEARGLDVAQMIREANKLTDLKDRIEDIKNADENEYVAAFLEVRAAIRSNPRQYKRFFNKLRFYRFLRAADETPIFIDACEAVLALEHPDLHYQVMKSAGGFHEFAVTATNSKNQATKELLDQLDSQAGFKQLRAKLAAAGQ